MRLKLTGTQQAQHWKNFLSIARNPWLKRLLQLILGLGIAFFMLQYLREQWSQIETETLNPNIALLLLAQIIFIIGMGILPFESWLILKNLGAKSKPVDIWHAFFWGQMTKYLPGSIWVLPSRGFLYHQSGLAKSRSLEAVLWEASLMVSGASLMALFGFPLLADSVYFVGIIALLGGFTPALFLGNFVYRWLRKTASENDYLKRLTPIELHLSMPQMVIISVSYMVNWLILGLGFGVLVYAFEGSFSIGTGLELAGLFAAAWAVGFLVIIAPGGIGIRDGLLAIGVAGVVNDPLPLVIAVSARISWTIAEIMNLAISNFIKLRIKKLPESQ